MGKRPDYAAVVYSNLIRQVYKKTPIILGGIEASLRRLAHYDYWSDKLKRSILLDSGADLISYGMGEHSIIEIAEALDSGIAVSDITFIAGTLYKTKSLDSVYDAEILPGYEDMKQDKLEYARSFYTQYCNTDPFAGKRLVEPYNDHLYVVQNPPALPLSEGEMDDVYGLPYMRTYHPSYEKDGGVPAISEVKFSLISNRGCFGGCSFCSITEHEGRIIQSRSEDSIINEIEAIRDTVPGFTGVISDLGGPTANMYMLRCKSPRAEQTCRRLSCVYPDICPHMDTNHEPTINLYRRARDLKGIKKILIASGVRYDIAVEDPRYIKELATHHVGGYLKIAPEHTEEGPLSKMMKPGMGSYDRFKELFDTYSKQAGKEQYLIPYFISAHPGTRDEDMVNLALWLKKHRFRLDQVQNFYPSPLANSTTMYYTGKNPLAKIGYKSEDVFVPKGDKQRRLHKALLRYHDPANWPLIRQALEAMGKKHLIGSRRDCLVPAPTIEEMREARRQNRNTRPALTKHTPMATQRQTPATAKKASSTQSRLQNAGAKKRPKAAVGR